MATKVLTSVDDAQAEFLVLPGGGQTADIQDALDGAAAPSAANVFATMDDITGGGAPADADYLVGTAHAGLSAEIVVGASPGGELGGTWASPTVDASHSGSTHAAVQAAAEAASQPLDSDLTAIAALTTTSYGRAFLALADAAAARTALALGTAATAAVADFQPVDSDLTAIAALTTTSYGRSLLEAANAAGLRTLGGLVIGTDVAAFGDSRLSDARTPTAHATSHKSGGSDAVKLDELAAPTDVTTLNVSTTLHGLAPKLPNDATKFLDGTGAYTVPPGTGGAAFQIAGITSPVAIANTETVIRALTIAANKLAAGTLIRFRAVATMAITNTAAFSFRLRIGPTTLTGAIAALASQSLTSGSNTRDIRIEGMATIRSAGGSGTAAGDTMFLWGYTTGASANAERGNIVTSAVTVDTTVQNLVELTFISGDASNTYTWEQVFIEVIF